MFMANSLDKVRWLHLVDDYWHYEEAAINYHWIFIVRENIAEYSASEAETICMALGMMNYNQDWDEEVLLVASLWGKK